MESMRQLAAQLAAAERAALIHDPGRVSSHLGGMLTDAYGRNHNYLRISLTERCGLTTRNGIR